MVVMGARWKNKNSEAFAHADPMSKVVSELQSSLVKYKAHGLLMSGVVGHLGFSAVLLEVGLEEAELLNQACFGCWITTVNSDKQQYELSLEEAFYMCHSLNCLAIVWEGKCVRNIDELWKLLKSRKTQFPIYYKAYSHLRAKNWVVRSGIKYGVDFVAYHHHPSLVHSAYAVMVCKGDMNTRLKAWPSLHATVRLEDAVAKMLLVLHIKTTVYDGDLSSSLKHYTVEEMIIVRWNAQCLDDHTADDAGTGKSCESVNDVQCSPRCHFKKFEPSMKREELCKGSSSPVISSLNTRWKGKSSKALALSNPMSELVAQLQSSLFQSKACGLLAGSAVLIMVSLEQADLLNRACFGSPIFTATEGTHWYELSLEEAFYLSHAMKCIELVSENQCVKNEDELWDLVKSKRKLFPISYKAYSHLRAKNWVVRLGIQYGVDFVAYSHHPSLVHSEYAVLVSECNKDRDAHLAVWPDVHATVRLEGGVAKTLLLLHIKKNNSVDVSYSCLKHYTVEEQTITRWCSEQRREDRKFLKVGTQ